MKKTTGIIIVTFVILWLLAGLTAFYDMYLFYTDQETISDKLTGWGLQTHPIFLIGFSTFFYAPFCFIAGLLIGHWFWPNSK